MNRPLPALIALLPLTLAGCADEAPRPSIGRAPAALLTPPGACDASEPTWIAVKTDPAPCPDVPGWAGAALFPGLGGPLARFCTYTGGAPADLLAEPGLVDAGPDCGVVGPQGALDDASGPLWAAAHARRVDPVGWHPGPATVAVLDTAGPGGSRSPHGPAMAALVERAAPGADVLPRVALPRIGDGTLDWHGGGHYGSPGELATAVVDAAQLGGSLVINLSLGWTPVGPMDDAAMPGSHLALLGAGASGISGPVRAAHAALVYAVCEGALVVAAAGNDPIGAGEGGPLLPAGWAALEAPDGGDCAGLGFGGPGAAVAGRGLVEAVGGVDLADGPLLNGRPGSRPRLVAPAQHAAVELDRWHVFSGTSAAAASVSGAAAAVWLRDPGMAPGAVADALYEGGVDLGWGLGAAELCGPGGCPPVRRLSICGAVSRSEPGLTCSAPTAFDGADLADVRDDLPSAAGPLLAPVSGQPDGCGAAGACPLPFTTPPSAPWPAVAPQPEWPGCPSCSLDRSTGTLVLEIDEAMPALSDPVLTVKTATGGKHYDLSARLGALHGGQTAKVGGLSLPSGVEGAWITFTVEGKTGALSKGNPIAVR